MKFTATTSHYQRHWVTGKTQKDPRFLANVNSRSRSIYAIARPSVCLSDVCNARAPYSGRWKFRQYFYGIWYLGHPLAWLTMWMCGFTCQAAMIDQQGLGLTGLPVIHKEAHPVIPDLYQCLKALMLGASTALW